MSPGGDLYVRFRIASGRLEDALLGLVGPLLGGVRGDVRLEAAYFARYRSEALLFVHGDPDWLDRRVRADVEERAAALCAEGLVSSWIFPEYRPETERYGGEEGLGLAGRIFQEDSAACLGLIDAERRGRVSKSRRELSVVLTERLLDLLRFDDERRVAFYRHSYRWEIEQGTWQADDLALLEERYRGLRYGLGELIARCRSGDPDDLYGGSEPARLARDWIEATRPAVERLLEAHAAGRIRQELVELAWSYTHMHCNRLGIAGDPEAVLRFFMHRAYEDRAAAAP